MEVSGLRSQLSGLRSQVSGLRSQVSGLGSRVSGLRSQVSGLRTQVSGLRSQVSGLGSIVSIFFFVSPVPISIGFPFETLHPINVSSTYIYVYICGQDINWLGPSPGGTKKNKMLSEQL